MNIRPGFWLRWSWRDLRSRWLQVVAVSIIIALGTGIYSGLSGQRTWRENSYDDSYALLNMYDLKVKLASGSFIDDAELQTMLAGIDGIDRAEGRLQTATLVDASEAAATEDSVLIPGVVVGVDLSEGGPRVNGFFIREDAPFDTGRNLTEADNGQLVATIPYLTASQYGIEPGSALHISGNVTLEVIGVTMTPEYFLIVNPDSNNIFSFGNFFPVFVPLETAQQISGREGLVNDFVLTLQPNIDPAAVQAVIEAGMESTFPDVGYTVEDREDNLIYTQLYQDAEGDQGTWTSLAILFLLGASFGVFNLAGRMVESQRRQIGIGMALGVPRRWIALRPMLVGVQIAVLGTFFGGLMGFLFSQGFGSIMDEFAPMPLFEITLYLRGFLVAVALGIILPVLATLIPVWRAVRVSPIDAIKTGHLVAKGGGLSGVLNRLPLPGDSFTQMPFRNILRAPWRTLLTVLGIALAILLLVVFKGFLDTFLTTMDKGEAALLYTSEDRVIVGLDFFYPVDTIQAHFAELTAGNGDALVTHSETQIALGGILHGTVDGETVEIPTTLDLLAMDNDIWTPRLLEGDLTTESDLPALVISQKAAEDLSLEVGDTVTMEHPKREGLLSFDLVKSEMLIVGIHDNPIRSMSYMDISDADFVGLEGTTNSVVLQPNTSTEVDTLKRALLSQPGVTSVDAVADVTKGMDQYLGLITSFLFVISGVVVGMAFLISFNTTSINVDERSREIATMFAFGLPVRIVTRMQMVENFLTGVLGTLLGIVLGWLVLVVMLQVVFAEQLESIKLTPDLQPFTILLAAVLGIVTVVLTPLLSIRKMRRMDIPSELRVME